MKTISIIVVMAVLVGAVLVIFNLGPAQQSTQKASPDAIERGHYLVSYGGCHDCHSPKIMTAAGPVIDSSRMLMGHPAGERLPEIPTELFGPDKWGGIMNNNLTAWAGPWGVSFAMNLTPDNATGLGAWTESTFIKAMRTGKHMGAGRPILPPMPWFSLAALTDEDLSAVFAYLKSIPPIQNEVPLPIPPASAPER